MTPLFAREDWIGKTAVAEDVITPRLDETFRATLAPALAPSTGEAPLGIHWCLAPVVAEASGLGEDGHPAKGGFLPPVPLPRRMWAAGDLEFLGPLQVGDRVRRTSTIADIADKAGRSGALTFVTVLHDLESETGPALRERQVIVYREAAGPSAAPRAEPKAAESERTWHVKADPVLLFRYSALTFNGHRIHYDQPYAVGVEGYPGLVVHGPLQATILLNLAAETEGRAPRTFAFRGLSPATSSQVLNALAMRREGDARRLRIEVESGRTTMTATAEW